MQHWKVTPETNHVVITEIANGYVRMNVDGLGDVEDSSPNLYELLQTIPAEDLPKYARISVDKNGRFSVKM